MRDSFAAVYDAAIDCLETTRTCPFPVLTAGASFSLARRAWLLLAPEVLPLSLRTSVHLQERKCNAARDPSIQKPGTSCRERFLSASARLHQTHRMAAQSTSHPGKRAERSPW